MLVSRTTCSVFFQTNNGSGRPVSASVQFVMRARGAGALRAFVAAAAHGGLRRRVLKRGVAAQAPTPTFTASTTSASAERRQETVRATPRTTATPAP